MRRVEDVSLSPNFKFVPGSMVTGGEYTVLKKIALTGTVFSSPPPKSRSL